MLPRIQAIDQLVDTFGSGGRQNALLVGRPGVGKTTIIHAFAEKLLDASAKVPDNLRCFVCRVFLLDSSALISAAPGRGELENLITQQRGRIEQKHHCLARIMPSYFLRRAWVRSTLLMSSSRFLEAGNFTYDSRDDEQRISRNWSCNPTYLVQSTESIFQKQTETKTITVLQSSLL